MTIVTTVGAMMDAIERGQAMSPMEQPERPRLRDGVHYIETEFATRLRMLVNLGSPTASATGGHSLAESRRQGQSLADVRERDHQPR